MRSTTLLPLIYTNVEAAGVFIFACLVWNVPEMMGMVRQMAKRSRKAAVAQDGGSLGILIGLQLLGLALNFFFAWVLPSTAISWQRTALFVAGVIAILLGVALRWYAIWTLGRYFTRDVAVSADQQVI